ncbi:hypothetical protein Y032_0094g2705 [Ancylostoma ceylanicum]|uniref:Uncharacterized protein n=1 Tax=Ancylostoma ceylanicum TaxID=53326 RepID=A0A016TKV7_9BILA|nr:hypothetical protein Y032_0094g2705 [Ancylostoma ceylanicum]
MNPRPAGITVNTWKCGGVEALGSWCDLGVTYTHDLRFDPYIDKIVNTAHAKSNYILKAFSTRKLETLYKLFFDLLENVQKRFTYRIFARNGIFRISYKERLKRLKTTSILLRRIIFDQNLVYKTVTSGVDVNLEELFIFCNFNGRTRGHQLRLVVEKAHTQQFHVSFLVRAAKMWNDLPESIVLSSSPTSFNRKLEALLKKRGYISIFPQSYHQRILNFSAVRSSIFYPTESITYRLITYKFISIRSVFKCFVRSRITV